jgi:hypothetical protein
MDNRLLETEIEALGWKESRNRDAIGKGKVYEYLQRFKHSNRMIFYTLTKQSYRIEDHKYFLTWIIMDTLGDFNGELNIILESKEDLGNLMKILDIKKEDEL